MATVYSLVCWGGLTGKVVSISATTDVVTLTNHGLRNGTKLWPSGTLPSELNTSTPVYARSTGANTFTLHTSAAGAIANTGRILFAGSSTYAAVTLKSDKVVAPADLSKYGSTRVFDGLASYISARGASALPLDSELCEISEDFTETPAANLGLYTNAQYAHIYTINGAGHNGVIGTGYTISRANASTTSPVVATNLDITGITINCTGVGSALVMEGTGVVVDSCIISGNGAGSANFGVKFIQHGMRLINCLVFGHYYGYRAVTQQLQRDTIANNIFTKNTVGVSASFTTLIWEAFYNNISVGNTTTDWGTMPTSVTSAGGNAGTGAWWAGTNTSVSMTTGDFVDYANNDFRSANSSSPQVDSGVIYYNIVDSDISGGERPNYNNGGSEGYDVGCFEFDNGFGPHPASTSVTFQGVVAGSEIRVYDAALNELAGVEACTANHVLIWPIPANPNVKVTIIKRGLRWMKFPYTSQEGNQSIPIFQDIDLGYNNPP